jgi:hypothetical protein
MALMGRTPAHGSNVISLMDADRDLAELLDADEVERARRDALARVQSSAPAHGTSSGTGGRRHHRGFLIVDGLLSRDVDVPGPPLRRAPRSR